MHQSKAWVTSDPHLGHQLMVKAVNEQGIKIRPWSTIEDMNADLLARWNDCVHPKDRVYVLGDWAMNRRFIALAAQFHGRKHLVMGNHDTGKFSDYAGLFTDLSACVVKAGMVLTHVPVHPSQLVRFGANVHGHLHHTVVTTPLGAPDRRYVNVCVEHTDYAPVRLDAVIASVESTRAAMVAEWMAHV